MALGDVLSSFAAPGASSDGLTWDPATGTLWHVNGTTIYNLDPADGSTIDSFSAPGVAPTDLAWDGTNLWVADTSGNNLTELDPSDGSTVSTIPSPEGTPRGLAHDGTTLWCADGGTNEIFQVDPADGSSALDFAAPAADARGLAWDPDTSMLWHANPGTDLIYQLNPANGAVITSFSAPGTESRGLAYDPATGTIWVADATSNTIYQLEGLAAPPVPVATLVEDFDAGLPASMTSFGTVNFTAGGVELTPVAAYSGVETSATNYALTSSTITTQMTVAPDAGAGTVQALLNLRFDAANQIRIGFQADQLRGDHVTTGPTFTNVFSVTYSTTGLHDWMAIAESSGQVAFRSSHNGSAWTDQGSFTASDLTSVLVYQPQLIAGYFGEETPPLGIARFEHINVEPRVEFSGAAPAAAEALGDLTVFRALDGVAAAAADAKATLAIFRDHASAAPAAGAALGALTVDKPVNFAGAAAGAGAALGDVTAVIGYVTAAPAAAAGRAALTVLLGPRDMTVTVGASRLGWIVGPTRGGITFSGTSVGVGT